MGGVMDFVKGIGLGPAGIAAGAIGGVAKTIGAVGQVREAKRQLKIGDQLASRQKAGFGKTYDDLMNLANNQTLYKGDVSLYNKAESEAKKQQALSTVNPADQLLREQARLGTANYIENASRGAKSGSDLMSIAGIGNAQESQNMAGININSANQQMSARDRANQNMINTLSATAAASARERGLEYESLLDKQQNIQGLTKQRGLGALDMDYQQTQEQLARRAALQNAKGSVWSSVGDIMGTLGSSMGQMNMMNKQMEMYKTMGGVGNVPIGKTTPLPNAFDAKSNPIYNK